MMAAKRVQSLLLALIACFATVGCWGQQDIDRISIVFGIGVDQEGSGQVSVTAQVVNPPALRGGSGAGSSSGGGNPTVILTSRGNTVEDAFAGLSNTGWRRPYYGHTAVAVFGQEYARHGIDQYLDYVERHHQFRKQQLLFVTSETIAELTGPNQVGVERLTTRAFQEMARERSRVSKFPVNSELQVVGDLLSPSHSITLPVVDPTKTGFSLTGLAVFKGTQAVTVIPERDTEGFMLLRGQSQGMDVNVPCPHSPTGNGVRILNTTTRVHPLQTTTGLKFVVTVRGQAELVRVCSGDRVTPQFVEQLGQATSRLLQGKMERAMALLQQNRVDGVQFGNQLFRRNPRLWRQVANHWQDTFATAKVVYDVKVNILRTGLTLNAPEAVTEPRMDQRIQDWH